MDEHQGRKSEMDAREEKISSVLATGEQLIENGHYATSEVIDLSLYSKSTKQKPCKMTPSSSIHGMTAKQLTRSSSGD